MTDGAVLLLIRLLSSVLCRPLQWIIHGLSMQTKLM